MIELPSMALTGQSTEEIVSYLYRMVEQLNFELQDLQRQIDELKLKK